MNSQIFFEAAAVVMFTLGSIFMFAGQHEWGIFYVLAAILCKINTFD